jgi:hypothetical protein
MIFEWRWHKAASTQATSAYALTRTGRLRALRCELEAGCPCSCTPLVGDVPG